MVTPWWQIVIGFALLAAFFVACWLMVWDVTEHAERVAREDAVDELWADDETGSEAA